MLLLDEPTNDLDIETLNVLEDFLDGWPGTLVVVSHDRYFLERVTDSVWALLGDGQISMLPRGVDEYLERRAAAAPLTGAVAATRRPVDRQLATAAAHGAKAGQRRGARRPQDHRPDRQAARADRRAGGRAERRDGRRTLTDYERLAELERRAAARSPAEKDELEMEWLEAAELLE